MNETPARAVTSAYDATPIGVSALERDLAPAAAAASGSATVAPAIPEAYPPASISKLNDYYELTKPRLGFLVLFTVAVGFIVGSPATIALGSLVLTVLGVLLVTACGAILNQVLEIDVDGRMHRTADRPLAAGRIRVEEASTFAAVAGLAGLALLATFVNPLTAILAGTSLVLYVVVYTPLKRVTALNTVIGAVPGALPPVMGYAAASGELGAGAWALFGLQFAWQMPHFYAIAWRYREDYARGGFRMLSLDDADGKRTVFWIRAFTLLLVPMSLMPTLVGTSGTVYLIAASALGAAFLSRALSVSGRPTSEAARILFLASILYLPLLFAAMVVDRFLPL